MFASKDQFFAGNKGYQLTRSLRFRSSASAYLNRTFGTSSGQTKFTLSLWAKRGTLTTQQKIFSQNNSGNGLNWDTTGGVGKNDALAYQLFDGTTNYTGYTNAVFRDPSSWYHIVWVLDSTLASGSASSPTRVKIYVNGNLQSFGSYGEPALNFTPTFNANGIVNNIGAYTSGTFFLDGYLGEINFIDGQALTPSSFGQSDPATGVWVPKKYIGTYGNNGFYLPFTDTSFNTNTSSGNLGIGKDFSGNGNYWTSNNINLNNSSYTTYTSGSGTYTVPAGVTSINYLVVGGGGGGAYAGGGGGAGGMLYGSMSVTPGQTISYSVGAGGNGSTASATAGSSGSSSSFGSITAAGGGGGGSDSSGTGGNGGSGGGGGASYSVTTVAGTGNTPATTPPQGNNGGYHVALSGSDYSSGGGGGAGAVGGNNSGNTSGSGGAGLTWINGTTYAGGGGGGGSRSSQGGVAGAGGAGGGGAGNATSGNGTAGTANTGGGGGGGSAAGGGNTAGNGGNGGSGVVVIGVGGGTNSTYDSMIDVPYCTGQVGGTQPSGNYATQNPLIKRANNTPVINNGNLDYTGATSAGAWATQAIPSSGKFYCECTVTAISTGCNIGLADGSVMQSSGAYTNSVVYLNTGSKNVGGTTTAYGATYTTNDVIGIAADASGTVTFYKNNVSQGAISTTVAGLYFFLQSDSGTASWNFGQRPFTYTPPSGYSALCAPNLALPIILNGAGYMAATLYTGTGASLSVANTVGSKSFQPDLVWIKSRSAATNHNLFDAIRGTTNYINSNTTNANASNANTLTAFNSNGFTVGTDASAIGVNVNAATYVGWQWLAGAGTTSSNSNGSITSTVCVNTTSGFSVVTFTSPASGTSSFGHSLGVTPSFIIVKSRASGNWICQHTSTGTQYTLLNTTGAATTDSTVWNSAATSTVVNLGTGFAGSINYVAYCFAPIAGYSAFGSYTGNGSADGPFVYCGFRPRYVLLKAAVSGTGDWPIIDSSRGAYNVASPELYASLAQADTSSNMLDLLSNGFKNRSTNANANASSVTYIYAAFAENPFNYANAR